VCKVRQEPHAQCTTTWRSTSPKSLAQQSSTFIALDGDPHVSNAMLCFILGSHYIINLIQAITTVSQNAYGDVGVEIAFLVKRLAYGAVRILKFDTSSSYYIQTSRRRHNCYGIWAQYRYIGILACLHLPFVEAGRNPAIRIRTRS
jgi:hypothetical protein